MKSPVGGAPLLYESHLHTPLCKHAIGEPEDYAQVAWERGLRGVIVTCHGPLPDGLSGDVRMAPEQFEHYVAIVQRARAAWEGRVDVRLGLESDYWPGLEPWLEKLHARAEFHHVLGSVHPQIKPYQERFFRGDWFAFQQRYFEDLANAAESGFFDTLSHPDLVKNCEPSQWQLPRLLDPICRALDRIARAGTAMELNTSGLKKAIPEMNPGREILALLRERGIPVVLGADAHTPRRVGDHYLEALNLLEDTGFRHVSFFLDRKRQEVPIAEARASLAVTVQ